MCGGVCGGAIRWVCVVVVGWCVGRVLFGAGGWLDVISAFFRFAFFLFLVVFFNFLQRGRGGSENCAAIIAKSCHFYCEIKMEIGITSCYSV